jgi:hypothetical protein
LPEAFQEGPPYAPPTFRLFRAATRISRLCRVDIGVDELPLLGADEAGPADATCRIDGAAGVAALRGLAGSMTMMRDPYLKIRTLALSLANETAPQHPKNRVTSAMPGAIS